MGEGTERRRLLETVATVFAGGVSGCSAIADWTEERARRRRERTPRLCRTIELGNYDSEPHVFHVLIERDGEIMLWWKSDEIPDHRVVEVELGAWHWERGQYTIYGSYDDYADWAMEDLSTRKLEEDVPCLQPAIQIFEQGNVIVTTIEQARYPTPITTEGS